MATIRIRWDISINDNDQISGGYLETTKPMTKTEVKQYCANIGKELLRNNVSIKHVSYSCWEEDDESTKNVSDLQYVYVSVSRIGKKLVVYKD